MGNILTRNCPSCGKVITYSHTTSLHRANRHNSVCNSCDPSRKRRRGDKHPLWSGVGEMPGRFWSMLIYHASARKLEVDITKEYLWDLFVKQNRKCALTGLDISFRSTSHKYDGTASLDRIDSTKGYVKGNLQWVHKNINRMKSNYSEQEFIDMCRKVVSHAST